MIPVGLVAGRDDESPHGAIAPRAFEHVPGALDVGLEGGDGMLVRHADDRLRGEMEHRIHLVFADGAFDGGGVLELPEDNVDARQGA